MCAKIFKCVQMDSNMDVNVHNIENFFGVYLLYCENPKYLGNTYIGFTVDPNRRIKQHNKGKKFGGAWKTSNKGPWKMVLIIHGFPNDIAALRFEWAWQHPDSSRRLNHLPKKKNSERVYEYRLRILSDMLRIGPWNRLPLTIRWLAQEYEREFPAYKTPPVHMPFCYGPVQSTKKISQSQKSQVEKSSPNHIDTTVTCFCCLEELKDENNRLSCLSPSCDMYSHFECLADLFLEVGEYVPVEGDCPKCGVNVLWGDLVRKSHGCYKYLANSQEEYSDLSEDEL